jgi:phospholipid N-methyltransferase
LDRSLLRANLLFARTFLRHPVRLGSLIPSSPLLVKRLLQQIDWDNTRVLVEYGPGVGTVTTALLRRLHPSGVLVAIDYHRDFAEYLRRSIRDPRLRVVHQSAVEAEEVLSGLGLKCADCVVSGIPHSTITAELREQIVRATRRVLRPGGSFVVYQFTAAVLPHLQEVFGEVRQERELMNILPAKIFCCSR